MSQIITSKQKPKVDRYASVKSLGELIFDVALSTDDIRDMVSLVQGGKESQSNWEALIAIISISLALQLAALIMAIILMVHTLRPRGKDSGTVIPLPEANAASHDQPATDDLDADPDIPKGLQRLNDGLTVVSLLIAGMHFIKNALKD